MLHSLQSMVGGAVMERATLLANHIISAEPVAMARLRRHSGAALQVEFAGWPSLLPALPTLAFRVTPAGLVEWLGEGAAPEAALRVEVDASNPALVLMQTLSGSRPKVTVAGDSAFAGDIDWLIDNLRWDVEDDLGRVVGQGPAHQVARIARVAAGGVREAVRAMNGLVAKAASGAPPGPSPR